MKRRLQRLMPPPLNKIADELKAGGEFGRGLPGAEQAKIKAGIATVISDGEPSIPAVKGRTEIYTHFTRLNTDFLLYAAERWVTIHLMLETEGALVDVGNTDSVAPAGSGKGISLPLNVDVTFSLHKGERLVITSPTAGNRVRVIIETVPWGEQVATMIGMIVTLLRRGK